LRFDAHLSEHPPRSGPGEAHRVRPVSFIRTAFLQFLYSFDPGKPTALIAVACRHDGFQLGSLRSDKPQQFRWSVFPDRRVQELQKGGSNERNGRTRCASAQGGPADAAQMRVERKLSVATSHNDSSTVRARSEALEAEESTSFRSDVRPRDGARVTQAARHRPQPLLDELDQRYVPGEIDLDLRDKASFVHAASAVPEPTWLSRPSLVVVAGILYEWRSGTFPWPRIRVEYASPSGGIQGASRGAARRASCRNADPGGSRGAFEHRGGDSRRIGAAALGWRRRRRRDSTRVDSESWVEIRDADGKTLMSQLNPAGSRRVIVGRRPLSLVIGNGAAVRLIYNDSPIDLKPYIQIEVARLTLK